MKQIMFDISKEYCIESSRQGVQAGTGAELHFSLQSWQFLIFGSKQLRKNYCLFLSEFLLFLFVI